MKNKYNLKDIVWAIINNDINQFNVIGIKIINKMGEDKVHYLLENSEILQSLKIRVITEEWIEEDKLFNSKENLVRNMFGFNIK